MIQIRTLLVLEVLTTILVRCDSTTNVDHVCRREETYSEQVRMPVQQTVRVRSSNWCLDIPPRCSNYKTEIREVIKVQNVTKTRMIEFCCEGYARITTGNDTVCRPICRGGCGRGYCQAPNQCSCDAGYTGSHCTQRCAHDRWGESCSKVCRCRNNSVCDNQTGLCLCTEGWMGETCESPCPQGFYGTQCRTVCECSSNRCNPQTGECISDNPIVISKQITSLQLVPNSTETSLQPVPNTLKISNERINATEWVRVETETTLKDRLFENEKYQLYNLANNSSSVIETLNSTIANLTENINKLTKNLDRNLDKQSEPVTILISEPVVEPVVEITTVRSIQEVILIKPENPRPAIFVHQPTVVTGPEQTEVLPNPPEVIHFITNWQTQTKDVSKNETKQDNPSGANQSHDLSAVISVLVIFSLVVLGAAVAFVVLYRKYLIRNREQNPPADFDTIQRQKTFAKPLPDLPAFTQNLTKTEIPEFYDRPKNNKAVRPTPSPYSYTSASLYSVVSKNYPRKHSLEHLYDEIKYPPINNSNL